jgi:hypothetical protein
VTVEISAAFLVDGATGQAVDAELWDAISDTQLNDWEFKWTPALQEVVARLKAAGVERGLLPQSRHWNWREKAEAFGPSLANPAFSVMCQGTTQGMMILDTLQRARLESQVGKELIYIDYLEIAPWNRRHLHGDSPRLAGTGSLLMRVAIEVSQAEGFKGRVGLHSLPQSNAWYTRCGMTDLGPDAAKQNLNYFEMTPEQANAFIARGNQP